MMLHERGSCHVHLPLHSGVTISSWFPLTVLNMTTSNALWSQYGSSYESAVNSPPRSSRTRRKGTVRTHKGVNELG